MRIIFLLWLTVCLAGQAAFAETKVVSGSILLAQKAVPDFKALVEGFQAMWKIRPDSLNISDKTAVFSTPGATVMLAYLDYPAPATELEPAALISWLWKNAENEAPKHQAQLVISVIGSDSRALDLYKLFTKVACSGLEKTASLGIFMSAQYLVLEKGYFLASARGMTDQNLPVYCWVYFGLLQKDGQSSGYTYGLHEFGLPEMEIVNSANPMAETHAVLYDAARYVVSYNIRLKDGQNILLPDGQKLPVALSDGAFVKENQTLKVAF